MLSKLLSFFSIIIFIGTLYSWQGYYGQREYMMEELFFEMFATPCSILNKRNPEALNAYRLAINNFFNINKGRANIDTQDLDKEFDRLMRFCKKNSHQLVISYLMKRIGLNSDWSTFGQMFSSGNSSNNNSSNYYDRNNDMMNDNNQTNDPNGYYDSRAYNNNNGRYYDQNNRNNRNNNSWGNNNSNNNQNNNRSGGSVRRYSNE